MPPSSPDGSAASPTPDHARLQHQTHRLAHRHEVALHVGMRDGQRAAALQLALEQRHHGAGAAQHVAEAHGDAAHAAPAAARGDVQRLAVHLGQPLRGAHHRGRVDRLVGGDQHHRQRADTARRIGDMAGAGDVGQQALQRIGLDHRHVLQRRGVEHQFRPPAARTRRARAPRRECRPAATRAERAGGARPVRGRSATARIRRCRAGSAAPGPRAATWRASSLPMVPPAPVTMTRRPWISRAMPSRSSGTCARFSRSSIAIGRSSSSRARSAVPAGSSEVGRGARRIRMPCLSACSTRIASDWPGEVGRGDHQRVRQPALAAQPFQHRGGILDRAKERVTVDAPPGLARADRQQSLDLQRLPPIPGQRAQEQVDVLGRPDHERRRDVGGIAGSGQTAAAVAPAAIDDAWRRRAAPAGSVHTRRERRDCPMPRRSAQARSRAGRRQARWTRPPQAGRRFRQNARIATAA